MVIVGMSRGIIGAENRWAPVEHNETFDTEAFREVRLWVLGKIPWRNIRTYDAHGDEYYIEPHLYCAFANDGSPYESYAYALIGKDYDWLLDPSRQLEPRR